MVYGYRCSCCGERSEGDEPPAGTAVPFSLVCQPCGSSPGASLPDLSVYTIPPETGVVRLEARAAFEGLTPKEQAYALALSQVDL